MPHHSWFQFLNGTKKFLATGCLGFFVTGCAGGPNMAEFFTKTPGDPVVEQRAPEASTRQGESEKVSPLDALLTRRKNSDSDSNPFAELDRRQKESGSNDPFLTEFGEIEVFESSHPHVAKGPTQKQPPVGTASLKQSSRPKGAAKNQFVAGFDSELQQIAGQLDQKPKSGVTRTRQQEAVSETPEATAPPFPDELFERPIEQVQVPPFAQEAKFPPERPVNTSPGRSRIRSKPTTETVAKSVPKTNPADLPAWARETKDVETPVLDQSPIPVSIKPKVSPTLTVGHRLTPHTVQPHPVGVAREKVSPSGATWPIVPASPIAHPLEVTEQQTTKPPEVVVKPVALPTESPFPPVLMPSPEQQIPVVNSPGFMLRPVPQVGVAGEINESMIVDSDDLPSRFEKPGHFADIEIQPLEVPQPSESGETFAPGGWQAPADDRKLHRNLQYDPYRNPTSKQRDDLHTTGLKTASIRRVFFQQPDDENPPLWSTANSPRVLGEEPPASVRDRIAKSEKNVVSAEPAEPIDFEEDNIAFGQAPPPPVFQKKKKPVSKPKHISRVTVTPELQSEKALAAVDFEKLSESENQHTGLWNRISRPLIVFLCLGSAVLLGVCLRRKTMIRTPSSNV